MRLNAIVLDAQVCKLPMYDALTGRDVSDYAIELQVLDSDCMQQMYACRVTEGLSRLDELKVLKQQGACLGEIEQVVDVLRSELPAQFPFGQFPQVQLDVLEVKDEAAGLYGEEVVVKLVCRLVA